MTLVIWSGTEVTDAAMMPRQPGWVRPGKPGRPATERFPAMNDLTAMSWAGAGPAGAVKAVSVISTGTVRIRPEHPYGSRKPLY